MAGPIQIPESVTLAFHALALLAARGGGSAPVAELAVPGTSTDHLYKVMQRLSRAGLVSSRRGRKGGFSLARNPETIRLIDVWEALEGRMEQDICPRYGGTDCPFEECVFGSAAAESSRRFREYFEQTAVADLAAVRQSGETT